MKFERVTALKSGACIKIDNSLNDVKSIVFELEPNKKYVDHIVICNAREQVMDGMAYSDNNHVKIKNPILSERSVDLSFDIITQNLTDGDVIEGIISIVSNVGVLNVPYKYKIVLNNLSRLVVKIESTVEYYDLFTNDFDDAKKMFSSREIIKAPFMQDEYVLSLYEGLSKSANIDIAIIEFFKAFEMDATRFFVDTDDEITKNYINNTLDYLDISNLRDNKVIDSLNDTNDENDDDEINSEAISLINEITDSELLNVLASYCIRNNYINEVAFNIYMKVIEKGSNLSNIYSRFLLSIPEGFKGQFPQYIYRLYYEDKSYSFDDKLKLYENIINVFPETDGIYRMYAQEIREYAVSRINQNKITEALILIYANIFDVSIINENNYNNVLYLLRTHKIIVSNENIKKIIIRYREIDKETKYDVINGIAYVPIFFNSYVILYEDKYGNRFYKEDVNIRALFNRTDLENYIIEKFSLKEIVDMTKLIKLNEAEKLSSEYEIDEINTIENKMAVSLALKSKFKTKIVDYYFDEVMRGKELSSVATTFLKNLPFDKLSIFDKRKVLHILLEAKEYKFIYNKILLYGQDLMEDNSLVLLFSKLIDMNDAEEMQVLLNEILHFSKNRKKDNKLLMFLSNNYDGSIENMLFIMDSLAEAGLDTNYIAKKILLLCLECSVSEPLDHVYECFKNIEQYDSDLKVAYLNKKATDYFLDEIETSVSFFEELAKYLMKNYDEINELPIIYLLAITKYISTLHTLTNNDLRRILIKSMERLLKTDMEYAYYKNLNKHIQMPYFVMNKEYIEYHVKKDFVPKVVMTISNLDEKKETEMTKVFMNIYVKKVTVFKNEIIAYDIINSQDASEGVLMSGSLRYDENYEFEYPKRGNVRTTFDYINDAIVCLDRDNVEGLKKVVMEMTEKEEISKKMFNLYDIRN